MNDSKRKAWTAEGAARRADAMQWRLWWRERRHAHCPMRIGDPDWLIACEGRLDHRGSCWRGKYALVPRAMSPLFRLQLLGICLPPLSFDVPRDLTSFTWGDLPREPATDVNIETHRFIRHFVSPSMEGA